MVSNESMGSTVAGTGTNINLRSDIISNTLLNPFVPPAIKSTILKKIEKMEYIELEDLAPAAAFANKKHLQSSATAYCDSDMQTYILTLKEKVKKGIITNLAEWMRAWNIYAQAFLHFKPEMFAKLFKYQKTFVEKTCKYRFDAC